MSNVDAGCVEEKVSCSSVFIDLSVVSISGIFSVMALVSSQPGACFSKLPVITGPVKLFCFPFQTRVSKLLKIMQ